jgi:Ca2+-binding RTX toxin-like protein
MHDVISGSQDADRIAGGGGDDRLFGTEVLVTGPAPGPTDNDVLLGGPGNDHIHAGPGRDRVHCGPGQDIAFADRNDRVAKDCEKVHPAG